jgi:2-polyprenyl-3-methyl-5-hydroxy-6-metoxy-1,4-benzoquinol methylase
MHKTQYDINLIINDLIEEYRENPLSLSSNDEDIVGYLSLHRSTYIRTINDVLAHSEYGKSSEKKSRVLEIGGFTGIVSVCLSRLGYEVVFSDIPEFLESQTLKNRLNENNIKFFGLDLRDLPISQPDSSFDIVIMCEVLEHLNFNPLPVISEVNRILKKDGMFYLSLPNIASWENRLRLLKGNSIHNPISHLIANIDPGSTAKVGLHWREYTKEEVAEMLSILGFSIENHYFFDASGDQAKEQPQNIIKVIKRQVKQIILHLFPSLKWNQTAIATKSENTSSLDNLHVFLKEQIYRKITLNDSGQ